GRAHGGCGRGRARRRDGGRRGSRLHRAGAAEHGQRRERCRRRAHVNQTSGMDCATSSATLNTAKPPFLLTSSANGEARKLRAITNALGYFDLSHRAVCRLVLSSPQPITNAGSEFEKSYAVSRRRQSS